MVDHSWYRLERDIDELFRVCFFFLVLRFGFLRLFGFRSVFDVIESLALSRSTAFLSTRRLLLQTREA